VSSRHRDETRSSPGVKAFATTPETLADRQGINKPIGKCSPCRSTSALLVGRLVDTGLPG
jgi:hypothetical protein